MILENPFVAAQRGYQIIGGTRDTNYLATYPNFMLREGEDEFVIVYGVNHQKTGKVTYSSVSIYADKDRWFGVKDGTVLSPDFVDSARRYLPANPPPELAKNIDMFYVIKVARDCHGEEYCLQVNQPDFLDINGNAYSCELDDLDTPEIDPRRLISIRKKCSSYSAATWSRPRWSRRTITSCCTIRRFISDRISTRLNRLTRDDPHDLTDRMR